MAKPHAPSEVVTLLHEGSRRISVSEVAAELLDAFGGAREFARLYAEEFNASQGAGTIARTKMLEGLLRIVTQASAQNKGAGDGDVGEMSDEELKDALVALLGNRGITVDDTQGAHDGTAEPAQETSPQAPPPPGPLAG